MKKDGRSAEVIRKTQAKGQTEAENEAKIVFEYGDTTTDAGRYSCMINAHIVASENNFYIYSWY